MINEQVAMLALSRAQVPQLALLRQLVDEVGSAKELLENASHIRDIIPDATPRLVFIWMWPGRMIFADPSVSAGVDAYGTAKGKIENHLPQL